MKDYSKYRIMATSSKTSKVNGKFNKVVKAHTQFKIKNDGSDLLLYLLYVDFLKQLLKKGHSILRSTGDRELSTRLLDEAEKVIIKQYRC